MSSMNFESSKNKKSHKIPNSHVMMSTINKKTSGLNTIFKRKLNFGKTLSPEKGYPKKYEDKSNLGSNSNMCDSLIVNKPTSKLAQSKILESAASVSSDSEQ